MAQGIKGSTPKCSEDGCPKTAHWGGLCSMHAYRLKVHGEVGPVGYLRPGPRVCEVVDGDGPCPNRSTYENPMLLCGKHYQRWKRNGDPTVAQVVVYHWPENLLRRLVFHPPTDLPTGCITYHGVRNRGYGKIKVPGSRSSKLAHRMAYELVRGPIPKGLTLDHLCYNPPCVNPAHLEPVTLSENSKRYHRRRRAMVK